MICNNHQYNVADISRSASIIVGWISTLMVLKRGVRICNASERGRSYIDTSV